MVKVRGQISAIAMAIEDSDPKIADLAKHFFHELSTKVPYCYRRVVLALSDFFVLILAIRTKFLIMTQTL